MALIKWIQNRFTSKALGDIKSMAFDGSRYVTVPAHERFNFYQNNHFTAACQVNVTSLASGATAYLFTNRLGSGSTNGYGMYAKNISGKIVAGMILQTTAGVTYTLEGGELPAGVWKHTTCAYNAITGAATLCIDGQQVASSTLPATLNFSSTGNLTFGAYGNHATTKLPLTGYLANVAVFSLVPSASDCEKLYLLAPSIPISMRKWCGGYWKLDNNLSDSVVDFNSYKSAANFIVNGTFEDTSGWSMTGNFINSIDPTAKLIRVNTGTSGSLNSTAKNSAVLSVNQTYKLKWDVLNYSSGRVRGVLGGVNSAYASAAGTFSHIATLPSSASNFEASLFFDNGSTAHVFDVDNVVLESVHGGYVASGNNGAMGSGAATFVNFYTLQ